MRFRRKPSDIEAIQWDSTEEAFNAILDMGADVFKQGGEFIYLLTGIDGAQGYTVVPVGHWIAKAAENDFYPVGDEAMANWEEIE